MKNHPIDTTRLVHSHSPNIVALSVNSISDDCLFVGIATKMRLQKLLDEGDISAAEATMFYAGT